MRSMRLWQSAWSFISLALALAPDFSVGRRLASSMPLDAIWYVALSRPFSDNVLDRFGYLTDCVFARNSLVRRN